MRKITIGIIIGIIFSLIAVFVFSFVDHRIRLSYQLEKRKVGAMFVRDNEIVVSAVDQDQLRRFNNKGQWSTQYLEDFMYPERHVCIDGIYMCYSTHNNSITIFNIQTHNTKVIKLKVKCQDPSDFMFMDNYQYIMFSCSADPNGSERKIVKYDLQSGDSEIVGSVTGRPWFSPNGKFVFFTNYSEGEFYESDGKVYKYNIASHDKSQIASGYVFGVTCDGVFVRNKDCFFKIDINTNEKTLIYRTESPIRVAAVDCDGKYLLFAYFSMGDGLLNFFNYSTAFDIYDIKNKKLYCLPHFKEKGRPFATRSIFIETRKETEKLNKLGITGDSEAVEKATHCRLFSIEE